MIRGGRTKERRERLLCGVFAITNRNVKVENRNEIKRQLVVFAITNRNVKVENRNEIERQLVVFAITNRNVKSTLHFSG